MSSSFYSAVPKYMRDIMFLPSIFPHLDHGIYIRLYHFFLYSSRIFGNCMEMGRDDGTLCDNNRSKSRKRPELRRFQVFDRTLRRGALQFHRHIYIVSAALMKQSAQTQQSEPQTARIHNPARFRFPYCTCRPDSPRPARKTGPRSPCWGDQT